MVESLTNVSNQVAGSKLVFQTDKGHICKNATPNELKFYVQCQDPRFLPLQQVIPAYHGQLKMREGIDTFNLQSNANEEGNMSQYQSKLIKR